jgi:hypothetical protein
LRITFGDGFAQQFAGAHGVEKSLAGERIDKRSGIADQRPILADHGALRKCGNLRRRKNVAIETCAVQREFLFADKRLQMAAQLGLVVRRHATANAHRQMIAARERPDVPIEVREKFDDDGVRGLRNEVALGNFEFVLL